MSDFCVIRSRRNACVYRGGKVVEEREKSSKWRDNDWISGIASDTFK